MKRYLFTCGILFYFLCIFPNYYSNNALEINIEDLKTICDHVDATNLVLNEELKLGIHDYEAMSPSQKENFLRLEKKYNDIVQNLMDLYNTESPRFQEELEKCPNWKRIRDKMERSKFNYIERVLARNESSTIGNLRTYYSAQHSFRATRTPRTFGTSIELSEEGFIDTAFGKAINSSGSISLNGYVYREKLQKDNFRIINIFLVASPVNYGRDGINQYYLSSCGTIYRRDAGTGGIPDLPDHDNPEKDGWISIAN